MNINKNKNKRYLKRQQFFLNMARKSESKLVNVNNYDDFLDFIFITLGSKFYYPTENSIQADNLKQKFEVKGLDPKTYFKFIQRAINDRYITVNYPELITQFFKDYPSNMDYPFEAGDTRTMFSITLSYHGNGILRTKHHNRILKNRDHRIAIAAMIAAFIAAVAAFIPLFTRC